MELPFVSDNEVVKKPKNSGMFLMVSYMLQKGIRKRVLFSAPLSFSPFGLFFFVGNAYSPFWNFLHVFLEYFTFCHSEKKLSFYAVN